MKKYTVSDGKLILFLEPAEKGWYAVTSPFDPGITTQARTIENAFLMAYDAQKGLRAARAKLARQFGSGGPRPRERKAVSTPNSGQTGTDPSTEVGVIPPQVERSAVRRVRSRSIQSS